MSPTPEASTTLSAPAVPATAATPLWVKGSLLALTVLSAGSAWLVWQSSSRATALEQELVRRDVEYAQQRLRLRLLERRLELGVRGTFMGQRNPIPRYNAPTGFNPPVEWHSYEIYDLFAKYNYSTSLSFDMAIDNVTDQYYLDALSLGVVPAPGRTARLGMTLHF